MDHLIRFRHVMKKLQSDVPFARTVAKAACRAADPAAAAERFIADYNHIVDDLVTRGIGPGLARSLASIASVGAAPLAKAHTLLARFERVLSHVEPTHPVVARSIALSACRSVNALAAAHRYMKSYDAVVRTIQRIDPRHAHTVASLAFRTTRPIEAAQRYLKQLQRGGC
jgi:hypothetical protein